MSLPNKKRGFRSLIIDESQFNWRFIGVIDVRPKANKNNMLIVDFGWYDVWLYVNDKEKPPDWEPNVVTPQFVREAILAGIRLGWNPDNLSGTFNLKYRNHKFTTENNETEKPDTN